MISKEFAKKQIARLSGLSYFPTDEPPLKELVTALMIAETERDAIDTIDDMIYELRECPKPADIRRLAYAKGADARQERGFAGQKCPDCHGTGWRSRERVIDGIPYSGTERCDCRPVAEAPAALDNPRAKDRRLRSTAQVSEMERRGLE